MLEFRSKHRLDVLEPLFGFGHEGVFGFFVGGFVGGAEAEEGAGVVPGDGADRLLGDEVLAGGFGVFEIDAAAAGGRRWRRLWATGRRGSTCRRAFCI